MTAADVEEMRTAVAEHFRRRADLMRRALPHAPTRDVTDVREAIAGFLGLADEVEAGLHDHKAADYLASSEYEGEEANQQARETWWPGGTAYKVKR